VQKIEGQETGKKFEVGEDQEGVSTICPLIFSHGYYITMQL
jgi:hypothetical protein